ncbi:F subunit of K+-transporting ATPase (Potass_KdpF) [Synechococcus sp. PCC 7502]|uniref:potassium-transporting ATPase subunit F n=1 Tax=Synechococcus sp. PCC 7502 TaxID=1173263 RepID=UPI00029FF887|nr:potassium-transporting ATPase subunit F [Synechococcus sp. PCC 7502]AFY74534.1 F subunit of K+-transporting ATPase (Potass_KdpF) [Synechococcus sp. PCC 7502]
MTQIKPNSTNQFANQFKNELKNELKQHLLSLTRPKHSRSLKLFLLVCLNLIIAPAIYAVNSEILGRSQAYAIGILGIVTVSFSIYLFFVMFQPEKF